MDMGDLNFKCSRKEMTKRNSVSNHIPKQRNILLLEAKINASTFHTAIKFSLQFAQFFIGIFPIYVGGKTYKTLKIKWCHWRMVYGFLTFLSCILVTLADFHQQYRQRKFHLNTIFNIQAITKYVLFFKLCLEWPSYVKEWHKMESKMRKYEICNNLRKNLTIITLLTMTMATVEHLIVSVTRLTECLDKEASIGKAFKVYFVTFGYPAIFEVIDYSPWKGILLEFSSLQMAYLWNYSDVIIMLVSSSLKFKLEQITKRIKTLCKVKIMDKHVWSSVRKDYLQLSELCELSNNKLSYLIIVSYSTNLYFVLMQLFTCLRPSENYFQKVYWLISFSLLLLRLTCLCIFGSQLHEEWKNICFALQSIQSTAYNFEVERFVENAVTCELVFTGKNFFKITRGLLLKIAGTIVTYELVIIQFSMDTLKKKLE